MFRLLSLATAALLVATSLGIAGPLQRLRERRTEVQVETACAPAAVVQAPAVLVKPAATGTVPLMSAAACGQSVRTGPGRRFLGIFGRARGCGG